MTIEVLRNTDMLTMDVQTVVNPVNTVGVMGAGLARYFKSKYPKMFTEYEKHCLSGKFKIGKLWVYDIGYKPNVKYSKILNFPTKEHWKNDSKLEYIDKGLENFVLTYKARDITSIAFPLLGGGLGNIPEEKILASMEYYLRDINIPCYVCIK